MSVSTLATSVEASRVSFAERHFNVQYEYQPPENSTALIYGRWYVFGKFSDRYYIVTCCDGISEGICDYLSEECHCSVLPQHDGTSILINLHNKYMESEAYQILGRFMREAVEINALPY